MHITGGLGPVHGIEGFGPKYELPNAHAFNETCAAVGNVLFNHRMFLMKKDAKYIDVAEVALLNNVLAAVNLEGNKFFYVNPLDADGKYPFNHGTAVRAPWFGTACCPSNIARLIPQVPGMVYAHDEDNLFLTFYADSETEIKMGKTAVKLAQETGYPNDGDIKMSIDPVTEKKFKLHVRVPTWAQCDQFVPGDLYHFKDAVQAPWTLTVNGDRLDGLKLEKGFAVIERSWRAGDVVDLHLPMPIRVNSCREEVEANRGRIAFTRGPFVMCTEGIDNGGATQRFFFARTPDISMVKNYIETAQHGSFIQSYIHADAIAADGTTRSKAPLYLTPYYAWNNRDTGPMTVWFPTSSDMAIYDPIALPKESLFTEIAASHTAEEDTVIAIGDGEVDKWSSGNKILRWTSRGQPGQDQWVVGLFAKSRSIRSVGVFWMNRWQGDVNSRKSGRSQSNKKVNGMPSNSILRTSMIPVPINIILSIRRHLLNAMPFGSI